MTVTRRDVHPGITRDVPHGAKLKETEAKGNRRRNPSTLKSFCLSAVSSLEVLTLLPSIRQPKRRRLVSRNVIIRRGCLEGSAPSGVGVVLQQLDHVSQPVPQLRGAAHLVQHAEQVLLHVVRHEIHNLFLAVKLLRQSVGRECEVFVVGKAVVDRPGMVARQPLRTFRADSDTAAGVRTSSHAAGKRGI
ncbi:hypothetical protein EYF80_028926 [Liparis tanakae]|uniref:Uncharacterized protein n=1 Tax=Liparis tanakae TaxID=230148 RepID=A0A4Z2H4Y3_9TELE|nr:hypothetical protein EYF80_028926 [Liparis tanakae]